MRILRTIAFAIPLSILPVSLAAKTVSEYDRFTDMTTVALGAWTSPPHEFKHTDLSMAGHSFPPRLIVRAFFKGKNPRAVKTVSFGFTTMSTDWLYLKCPYLDILVDDRPVDLGKARHDGDVGSGYVSETIITEILIDKFAKVARAKKLEAKICNTELIVGESERDELLSFLKIIRPEKTTAAAQPQ